MADVKVVLKAATLVAAKDVSRAASWAAYSAALRAVLSEFVRVAMKAAKLADEKASH